MWGAGPPPQGLASRLQVLCDPLARFRMRQPLQLQQESRMRATAVPSLAEAYAGDVEAERQVKVHNQW